MNNTLLIPAKNEAKNMPFILPKIPDTISEVILVDGVSTDGTIEIAKKYIPNLKVVIQKRSKGKGGAIIEGIEEASGENIIIMDADGSMDPDEINGFINEMKKGYDLVKGSRFLKEGGTEDMTRFRKFGNWVFVKLVNLLYRRKFTDLCYGFVAIRKDLLRKINIRAEDFSIEAEIIVKAVKKKAKIAEIPSFEHRRIYGISNLNAFKDGISIFKTIVLEKIKRN
jgi:glycosyltransferase involved in cell wall biosynthesis